MGIECLLISTNQVVIPYPVYPLGIGHLAGALEASGHRASQFDLLAHGGFKGLKEKLTSISPDLIGLSIRNIDTVDSTAPDTFMPGVIKTMEIVRHLSSAPVVLGGPAFSILPEEFMDLLQADYGVVGEGEVLLPWLADCLERGELPQKRIFFAKSSNAAWQPVSYDRTVTAYYLDHGGMINIQAKRGCPYRCGYCSYPLLEGGQLRFREPEAVANEVMRVTEDLKARYIFFTDSVFNDARGQYLQVAEALIHSGNKTPWCAFFRPENLTKGSLAILKRAGLAAMEIGTDGATDTALAALNKGFSFADVINTNYIANSLDIPCAHFIIFGGPDEDEETTENGLANIEKLVSCVVFAFTGIRILPGTAIHKRAIEEEVLKEGAPLLEPVFYFSPKINRAGLEKKLRKKWAGRFDRIYPCSVIYQRINHLHQCGHIGPMWNFLVRHIPKK